MDRIYGNIFRALRERANLTQAEVAKLAGLSQSGVSRQEAGSRWPTKKTLRKLCKVFDISFDEFFSYVSGDIHKNTNSTEDWLDDDEEDEENERDNKHE